MNPPCPCRGCTQARKDERARIKAAVEALYMHAYPGEYGQLDAVLAIIDGEQA